MSKSQNSKLDIISNRAFEKSSIIIIEIPKSVSEIGFRAFYQCKNIKTVYFEDNSEQEISSQTFEGSSLEKITIPITVTKIDYRVFYNCLKLPIVDIDLNSNLQINAEKAFGNSSIETITFPSGVTGICTKAFLSFFN